MGAKLCPDVLDRLDIFVLEIEELEIPKVIKFENEIISYWIQFIILNNENYLILLFIILVV